MPSRKKNKTRSRSCRRNDWKAWANGKCEFGAPSTNDWMKMHGWGWCQMDGGLTTKLNRNKLLYGVGYDNTVTGNVITKPTLEKINQVLNSWFDPNRGDQCLIQIHKIKETRSSIVAQCFFDS
jgi:hypothetical protein